MRPSSRRSFSAVWKSFAAIATALAIVVGGLAAPASAVGTRTISGHVYLGTTDTSAGAAEVSVHYTTSSSSLSAAPSVQTDASGNYVISGLNAATYYLYFEYLGAGGFSSINWLNRPVGTTPTGLSVFSADQLGQDITLPILASISGTVSVGATGTYPAPGDVSVRYQVYVNSVWSAESAGVTTDASGNYSIPSLSAGVYRLHFVYLGAGGFQSKYWASSFFINGSTSITFPAGVSLTGQSVTLLAPQSIVGHVYLGTTATSAGAGEVSITPSYYAADAGAWVALPGAATTTDASGNYSITGLNSATYSLVFAYLPSLSYFGQTPANLVIGSASSTTRNVTLARAFAYSGHVNLGSASRPASVGEVRATLTPVGVGLTSSALTNSLGDFTITSVAAGNYTLTLHYVGTGDFPDFTSPTTLSITADQFGFTATLAEGNSISGNVTDSSGDPLAGATIVAEGSPEDPEPSYFYATTDASGNYSFKDLPDDTYLVQFSKVGYSPYWWGSATNFYVYPDRGHIEAHGGGAHDGVDGVLYIDSTLFVVASGSYLNSAVFASGAVTGQLQVFDEESGEWVDSYLIFPLQPFPDSPGGGGFFELTGVAPASYRVAVQYSGPLGVAFVYSTVVNVGEGDYQHTYAIVEPTPRLMPGTLVKGSGPTIYLVDGPDYLIPLVNFTPMTDAGLGSNYTVVSDSRLYGRIVDNPMTNLISCDDTYYIAAQGKLRPVDANLVADMEPTFLYAETCNAFPKAPASATIVQHLYLAPAGGGSVYEITADGNKRPVVGAIYPPLPSTPTPVSMTYYTVSSYYLGTLPTGPPIIQAGAIVKGSGPTVYLTDGQDELIPVTTWGPIQDLGLRASYTTVSDTLLSGYSIDPATLSNALSCGGSTYVSASGAMRRVSSSLLAGLSITYLQPETCVYLQRSLAAPINTALFLKSPSNSTNYYVAGDGTKHAVYAPGALAQLSAPDAPVVLTVNDAFLDSIPTGLAVLLPGMLVKTSTAPAVYLVDGSSNLVPVASFLTTTDAGLGSAYITLTAADLAGRTSSSAPLSNTIVCGAQSYFATEGKLWPVDVPLLAGLPQTVLDSTTCAVLPKATTVIHGGLIVQATTGGPVYSVAADGVKHELLSLASQTMLTAPAAPVVLRVTPSFLVSLPTGLRVLPVGAMVKGPGPRVYFVAGLEHLVPMLTFEATADMGLPSVFSVVTQADLDQAVRDPDSQTLSNVLVCGAVTYVASAGKLWPVDAALVAGLAKTTLDASACSVLPKSPTTIHGALFLTPTSGGAIWQVQADGSKKEVVSTATLAPLSAPHSPLVVKVGATFLNSLPTSSKVLPVGAMVKGPGPRVYFVAGFQHLVPMLTFEATSDMGLPSSFSVVSQADLDQAVKDPDSSDLSNVLVCGAVTYVASGGKLWPVDAALVTGLAKTALDASACSVLPKATTTVQGALFLTAVAGGATYQVLASSTKQQILSSASMAVLSAPSPPTVLKVGATFLNSLPTGLKVLPVGSMVKGPGPRVYFVAGQNHLVPMLTFEATADMGLPSTFTTVTQADLDQAVKDPDSQVLSNVLVCGAVTSVASAGKLWPVDAALVAGLAKTVLDASACSTLPKSVTAVQGALFLPPASGGAIYQVMADGTKRQLISTTTLTPLAAPYSPLVVKVGASFLNAIPTAGAKVLPIGSMVKGPGPRVYFVAGFQHLVPMLTFEATTDMGLPSTFATVTQADLDQAVKDPDSQVLSNVLVCGSVTYIASAGKLWPVDAALVAGLAKTTLDVPACAVLPKSATTVQGALFFTPAGGGAIWQIMPNGAKRQITALAQMAPLSAPYSPLVVKVGATFLNSLPTYSG